MAVAKELPYVVEISVPLGGLGERLEEMLAFHRDQGIAPHIGKGRRTRGRDYLRWRFAHLSTAIEFAVKFGAGKPTNRPLKRVELWRAFLLAAR